MGSIETPIPHGERLMPVQIDDLARDHPGRLCASIPKSPNLADGYRDVTYADVARAINRAAAWIDNNYGISTNFATLAYLGPYDMRYFILMMAVSKVGYKV